MIIINIPNNNIDERKYIIDIMFGEFLGLHYKSEVKSISNYEILLDNQKKIIVTDSFFNKYTEELEYLNIDNIPNKIEFGKNEFTPEKNIPILYGNSNIVIDENQIVCSIDIFASSYFMLTRWEEYIIKTRDNHNRFPDSESLAYQHNFMNRPIVNEYVEMLWNMCYSLDNKLTKIDRKYKITLTHDVDDILLYKNPVSVLAMIKNDILKRRNFSSLFYTIMNFPLSFFNKNRDPYYTFDWIMTLSESIGVKSHFFFMDIGETKHDKRYNNNSTYVKKLTDKIKKRGHHIGIHPSYNAYDNFNLLKKEKHILEKNLDLKINYGREHFLRFSIPQTWQIWERNSMTWDSTLGYSNNIGFRCGVCYEYSVFNILSREKLKLKEKPLIMMEASFIDNISSIDTNTLFQSINELILVTKRYNGNFVLLWHNSSFNTLKWKAYKKIYIKIIEKYKEGIKDDTSSNTCKK